MLTITQTAALANLSEKTLRRRLARGTGPAGVQRFGQSYAFDRALAEEWAESERCKLHRQS
jgi:hypothetical protein